MYRGDSTYIETINQPRTTIMAQTTSRHRQAPVEKEWIAMLMHKERYAKDPMEFDNVLDTGMDN
jgi:hypothetical protein